MQLEKTGSAHDKQHNVTQSSIPSPQSFSLSAFDRIVLGVIAALVVGILGVVLLGDRVGVTLVRVAPLETGHSTSPIVIQFSEPMNRDTVAGRLRLEPAVEGDITWSGATLFFRPRQALQPGENYTVVLERGAVAAEGRELLSEYRFAFTVMRPRVAYLAPADSTPQNIWVADPADPASAQQVTFSPSGVYDFGVSPDGERIAFAERNTNTGRSDIKMIDLETGALTQLTNCVDADCTTPVWRPDGMTIAYQRVDYNSDLGNVGTSPTRVWLIDLATTPASTRPLFADLQILGYSPQWSADGSRIAVFNRDQGILVYTFADDSVAVIPSRSGSSGALSPDGMKVVYPELILRDDQQMRSYLQLADLGENAVAQLSEPDAPLQDERVMWRPDGELLAVARRYQDERYTRGYQIYLMNPDDQSVEALTDDPAYANGFFFWDPTGDQLVVQRFPELDENGQPNVAGRPEVWTMDVATREFVKVATNAFHPRWVP
jgi:Tol biopolymer transport system component